MFIQPFMLSTMGCTPSTNVKKLPESSAGSTTSGSYRVNEEAMNSRANHERANKTPKSPGPQSPKGTTKVTRIVVQSVDQTNHDDTPLFTRNSNGFGHKTTTLKNNVNIPGKSLTAVERSRTHCAMHSRAIMQDAIHANGGEHNKMNQNQIGNNTFSPEDRFALNGRQKSVDLPGSLSLFNPKQFTSLEETSLLREPSTTTRWFNLSKPNDYSPSSKDSQYHSAEYEEKLSLKSFSTSDPDNLECIDTDSLHSFNTNSVSIIQDDASGSLHSLRSTDTLPGECQNFDHKETKSARPLAAKGTRPSMKMSFWSKNYNS